MDFSTMGLSAPIFQAVQEAGYTEPTPIQTAAIPLILAGHDLIGVAQTGTGKTAAFTLPLISRLTAAGILTAAGRKLPRALILAPTRELVIQIEENVVAYAKHLPLKMAVIMGGVSERRQISAMKAGVDIVIATPGRLTALMDSGDVDFRQLEYLILDEADRMLDMGFLPAIKRIVKALPTKRQTLLFSATFSKEIEALSREFLKTPQKVEIGKKSNPAATVSQAIYEVPKALKVKLLAHLLEDPAMESVLVFTRTKHGADAVSRKLEQSKIKCATMHSNRSQNQRQRALDDFKSGQIRLLVATDIASRGIDVEGISHVVNYDFPPQTDDYIHRIGRTGRAQAEGHAISFVTDEDKDAVRQLERHIGKTIERKKAEGFDYSAPAPLPSASAATRGIPAPGQRGFNAPRQQFGGGGRSGSGPGGYSAAPRRSGMRGK